MKAFQLKQTLVCAVCAVLTVAGAVAAATGSNELPSKLEKLKLPLLDYTSLQDYWSLKQIEHTGYYRHSTRYTHAPRVEWKPVEECAIYRLVLLQNSKILGETLATNSPAYIQDGWSKLKRGGKAGVVIIGYDKGARRVAISRIHAFAVAPDFSKWASAPKKRSFREAAMKAFDALYNLRLPDSLQPSPESPAAGISNQVLLAAYMAGNRYVDGPFTEYRGISFFSPQTYPNLHDWIYVDMCWWISKIGDEATKARALIFAESVGKHLQMCQIRDPDYLYRGLIRSAADRQGQAAFGFERKDKVARDKQSRMVEPAKCGYSGCALIKIYQMTGKQEYLDTAEELAEALMRTQLPSGTWDARVDGRSGEAIATYSTCASTVVPFMEELNKLRPAEKWVHCKEKALQWLLQYPCNTFGWVVNYEDTAPSTTAESPYSGLSNYDLFPFIRYLEKNPAAMPHCQRVIQEHLAWNDNHFVFYGDDPLLAWNPWYPVVAEQGSPRSFVYPGNCWHPMDFHTANWAQAMVAVYRLTGDKIYLTKAKAAANALTQYQLDSGATITWMQDHAIGMTPYVAGNNTSHHLWPAGWAMSAALWAQLVAEGYAE